jgi:acyl-CoA oxidase
MANLIIDGHNYGMHPFIVPIRDPVTHRALRGIAIGEIGPKMGVPSMDNGFIVSV